VSCVGQVVGLSSKRRGFNPLGLQQKFYSTLTIPGQWETSTWQSLIGPHVQPSYKQCHMPKLDWFTCATRVLPTQLYDVSTSAYSMYVCHVSPFHWFHMVPPLTNFSCFTKTLKGHSFLIRRMFEAIHLSLESSRRALHNEVIFKSI
jgi:hypothetical protein